MEGYFVGTVVHVADQEIVLEVGGVIGLTLQVASSRIFEVGSVCKIYTYLHWNEQTGPTLFGFQSVVDRSVFCTIIGCSGIGPKIALAILAQLGAHGFLQAITASDEQMLSSVSGIGKKKAEQIIVALKDKVAALIASGIDLGDIQLSSHFHDVSQTLLSLNYSRSEVGRAMDYLKKNSKKGQESFDYLLRNALSYLAKQL